MFVLINTPTTYSEELRNIAIGRLYEMSRVPDLPECSSKGDEVELTDGVKKGSFRRTGSTVGWDQRKDEVNRVEITIDLGWEREFEEVRIFTRVGVIPNIYIYAIRSNKVASQVGIIDWRKRREIEEKIRVYDWKGVAYTVSISVKKTKGRYVKIVMESTVVIALDEIEVLSSSPSLLEISDKKRDNDGNYVYTVKSFDLRGTEISIEGRTPWGEVLFEKTQELDKSYETTFSFTLPSELCHLFYFDLKDKEGVILERFLERIEYHLPLSESKPVQEITLDSGWSYQIKSADEKSFSDSGWKDIDLPQHFYPFNPFFTNGKPEVVWYKTKFFVPVNKDKTIGLKLNKVRYAPFIYVNGKLVAEGNPEPDLPHFVDITKFVDSTENELVIKVYDWRALLVKGGGPFASKRGVEPTNEPWLAIPGTPEVTDEDITSGRYTTIYPFTGAQYKIGDHLRFGILDDVKLLMLPRVYIEEVKVTPSVIKKSLKVELILRNTDKESRQIVISNIIGDIKNPLIKKLPEKKVRIPALSEYKMIIEQGWTDAVLWWPKRPHLYHLCTTIKENEKILEARDTRFGFREITADGSILRLNGSRLHLFGTHGSIGFANVGFSHLYMLDELNINCIRGDTLVINDELLNAADEMGFFVIDEGEHDSIRYLNVSQTFWDNAFSRFKQRVKRAYNHPSVIIYTIANEFALPSWAPREWGEEKVNELIRKMKRYDPTRFVEGGGFTEETITTPHYIAENTAAGYLLPNWYYMLGKGYPGTMPMYTWDSQITPEWSGVRIFLKQMKRMPVYLGEMGFWWRGKWEDAPMQIEAMRYNQIAGVSPNSWTQAPRAELKKLFSPFYAQIKSYASRLYAHQKIKRKIVLYNDYLDGKGSKELKLEHELKDNDKILDKDQQIVVIDDGEKKEVEVIINVPKADIRKEVKLHLRLFYENRIVFETTKDYSILPRITKLTSGKRILLYDKKGNTSSLLKSLYMNYVEVSGAKFNPLKDILIIGRNSLDEWVVKNKENIEGFVKEGGVVIVLSQEQMPAWLPSSVPVVLDISHPSTMNFATATDHPLLEGIEKDDLKFWWQDNITAFSNFKRPICERCRTIVETGDAKNEMQWITLLELPYYQGTYILNQFRLVEKFYDEPAASLLLRNMINYANDSFPW